MFFFFSIEGSKFHLLFLKKEERNVSRYLDKIEMIFKEFMVNIASISSNSSFARR